MPSPELGVGDAEAGVHHPSRRGGGVGPIAAIPIALLALSNADTKRWHRSTKLEAHISLD